MDISGLKFSIYEILSIIGLTQCVMILVYMAIRAGRISRAVLPFIYFLILGVAFFTDFAARFISSAIIYYDFINWSLWYISPVISVLLIVQIAKITKTPARINYLILLIIPLIFIFSYSGYLMEGNSCNEAINILACNNYLEWFKLVTLIAGGIALLTIWLQKNLLEGLYNDKIFGRDRYWLIIALIATNLILLLIEFIQKIPQIHISEADLFFARTVLGLSFSYIASTSLFRIYPQSVAITEEKKEELSEEELIIARKIEKLLKWEKVYHEPNYGRTELAHELQIAETTISKIIRLYFDKNLPQLLNEYRVEDAKTLLAETDAPIKTIALESGFNSIASFNRIFKELTGNTPGSYRKNTIRTK